VLNTLQGLFICVSFVFTTAKVRQLLKVKFLKCCGKQRQRFRVTKSGSTDITSLSKSTAQRKASNTSVNKLDKNVIV
jgi:hypothetical protein